MKEFMFLLLFFTNYNALLSQVDFTLQLEGSEKDNISSIRKLNIKPIANKELNQYLKKIDQVNVKVLKVSSSDIRCTQGAWTSLSCEYCCGNCGKEVLSYLSCQTTCSGCFSEIALLNGKFHISSNEKYLVILNNGEKAYLTKIPNNRTINTPVAK